MKAAPHPFEQARVAALRQYDILDTPRESDFDDIVALASQVCGTSISVINLIDTDRQWFKAEVGLGVRETPLDTSICAHVILDEDYVEIPDTLEDARMRDNPMCTSDPGLRFYAGVLLKSKGGYPIGTLCVLDNHPKTLTPLQREALGVMARQVMTQLDLRAVIANEKILRSEIDHRVKNSLQTVSAFVALERRAAQNANTSAVLDRVTQQIDTVAILHEHLGAAGDGDGIALEPYLSRVIDLIDRALPPTIKVSGSFDPIPVLPREAAVVGTIVNELAANAVKHSIRRGAGTIAFGGRQKAGGAYHLTCRDDGAGSREPRDADRRQGLGLAIIGASVRQLGGTMSAGEGESGYRTEIDIQLSPV
ncbi:MAG: histidine kinase dimerization/phosphoacceptor domain -containing protein [Sphingomicrobium sp.]